MEMEGSTFSPKSPAEAISSGLALAPEDRKLHGLVLPMSVRENSSLPSLNRDRKSSGMLDFKAEEKIAQEAVEKMQIKTPSLDQVARFLSGGNQQKLVLSREISSAPKILLVGQPTRGVDIGAIEFIHKTLIQMRDSGCAILLVSVELEEILSLSDRILVMNSGEIMGIVSKANTTKAMLGKMMAGIPLEKAIEEKI